MMNSLLPPSGSPSLRSPSQPSLPTWAVILIVVLTVHLLILVAWRCAKPRPHDDGEAAKASRVVTNAVKPKLREAPATFPANSYRPSCREAQASGSIDMETFSPGRDLTYLDDSRVWWESDNDQGDDEDDHTIHRSMEAPLRQVIELVCTRQGRLKVQDTYRPTGIHNPRSLHREGRAVDLTCDDLGIEELAKLCWQAGFDWVFHEAPANGGTHVHCSVRRQAAAGPIVDDESTPSTQTESVD